MRITQVSLATLACAIAMPAHAQDETSSEANSGAEQQSGGIQEIVVTAQKREENVQDVPIAISAFGAETLQERAVGDVSQLSGITPNVTLDASTPFSARRSAASAPTTSRSTSTRRSASISTASISAARSAPTRTCSTSSGSRSSRVRKERCSAATRSAARSPSSRPRRETSSASRATSPPAASAGSRRAGSSRFR